MTYTIYADKAEEVLKKLTRIEKKADKYGIPFSYSVSVVWQIAGRKQNSAKYNRSRT